MTSRTGEFYAAKSKREILLETEVVHEFKTRINELLFAYARFVYGGFYSLAL